MTWKCRECGEAPTEYRTLTSQGLGDAQRFMQVPVRCSTPGCRYNSATPGLGWCESIDDI